jgi:hypothetical protein
MIKFGDNTSLISWTYFIKLSKPSWLPNDICILLDVLFVKYKYHIFS